MCICSHFVWQPFGRALIESGKAFFEMERERNVLRHVHDSVSGKPFDSSVHGKLSEILLRLLPLTRNFAMQLKSQPLNLRLRS